VFSLSAPNDREWRLNVVFLRQLHEHQMQKETPCVEMNMKRALLI